MENKDIVLVVVVAFIVLLFGGLGMFGFNNSYGMMALFKIPSLFLIPLGKK